MSIDSITDDIRKIRHDLAAPFGDDLDLILADIRRREAIDGRTYVSLPPRRMPQKSNTPGDAPEPSVPAEPNPGSGTSF